MTGIYKYGQTRVIGTNSDCAPNSGTPACPYFVRTKIDSAGVYSIDQYAYYPIQKKWISLSSVNDMNIGNGDLNGTSAGWNSNVFSPTTASTSIQNNRRTYYTGSTVFQLVVGATNISGSILNSNSVFPAGSKQYTVALELISGKFISLKKGGFWTGANSTDDAATYSRLADLRSAHVTSIAPLCMDQALSVGENIVFNSGIYGGNVQKVNNICSTLNPNGAPVAVNEGVTTIANRRLILLSQPTPAGTGNTSDQQTLPTIGLTDAGVAARGVTYLPGYMKSVTGHVNQVAFSDWMKTQSADPAAQLFPK